MIHAYHVIFSTYGFWLPNDPRGSWSDFVGAWELYKYGPATKVYTRRSSAHDFHDHALRQDAKKALKYPPVHFTGLQARAVARGFAQYAVHTKLTIWACSIMPDHVHLVFQRTGRLSERIVNQLKGAATKQIVLEDIHPLAEHARTDGRVPKMWARGLCKVFLNSEAAIFRAIEYVEQNPVKEGKPRQRWNFVLPFPATRSAP